MSLNEAISFISINPEVRFGKPCITGTRISIGDILSWLASEMTEAEVLADFPSINAQHIQAALVYAANREAITKLVAA